MNNPPVVKNFKSFKKQHEEKLKPPAPVVIPPIVEKKPVEIPAPPVVPPPVTPPAPAVVLPTPEPQPTYRVVQREDIAPQAEEKKTFPLPPELATPVEEKKELDPHTLRFSLQCRAISEATGRVLERFTDVVFSCEVVALKEAGLKKLYIQPTHQPFLIPLFFVLAEQGIRDVYALQTEKKLKTLAAANETVMAFQEAMQRFNQLDPEQSLGQSSKLFVEISNTGRITIFQ